MQIRMLIAEHPRLNARFLALIGESGLRGATYRRKGKGTLNMKHNEQWDDIVYESQGYSEEALFQQSSDEVHLIISFKGSSKSSFAQEVCLMPGPVGRRTEMDMCYVFVPLGTTHSALAVIDEFLHRIRLRRIRPSDWSGNPTWEPSSSDDRGYRH